MNNELLNVVDENDSVLEYLLRSDVHENKLLHRTISVVVFNSKGELLLQQRSMLQDTYPGMFGNAAGGHVTKGKDYAKTAKDEVYEELGIDVPLEFVKIARIQDPNHPTMTAIYKATSEGPFKFQRSEIISLKFYPLNEVSKMKARLSPPTTLILKELGINI